MTYIMSSELRARSSIPTYEIECEERSNGQTAMFSEEHLMRYLFPTEVEFFAESCEMKLKCIEEFLTGAPPSISTWGVAYLLQRRC
jgi:hypothetical protein